MADQVPFSVTDAELVKNPEPRCPCVLLLDVSGSMQGQPIAELNAGLVQLKDELSADSLAAKRVELAFVTFGSEVRVAQEFISPENFVHANLVASGATPMGEAINKGLDLLQERKKIYNNNGINSYRPWVFLITDGGPTDHDVWRTAAARVKTGEAEKKFSFFVVGVEGANFEILKQIAVREPLKLSGLRFRDLFVWLSRSLKSVSASKVGTEIVLVNPAAPGGWATV